MRVNNFIFGHTVTLANGFNFTQNKLDNNIKVSVILPIYNQEKFIKKAISSLQNQTLKETEFICVNDGSKDNSLEILKTLACKDNRIKIIDQKNQGAGCARNNGLKAARGEYLAFLDPDDWFEHNALESLYNKAKKQNCDLLVFNFNKIDEAGNLIGKYNLKSKLKNVYSINEAENFNWRNIKTRVLGGLFPAAWNKLYKNELIKRHKLYFSKSNIAEDHVFVFGATLNAKNIGYSDDCFYNYQQHNKSALHTCSDKNLSMFKSFDSVKKLIKKLGLVDDLNKEFDNYILRMSSFLTRKVKSYVKFREVCQRKLSPQQNKLLQQRYLANIKIFPILESLINNKLK